MWVINRLSWSKRGRECVACVSPMLGWSFSGFGANRREALLDLRTNLVETANQPSGITGRFNRNRFDGAILVVGKALTSERD